MATRPTRYTKDPIVEALIALRFETTIDAERVSGCVKEHFEGQPLARWKVQVNLQHEAGGVSAQAAREPDGLALASSDGHWRLMVTPLVTSIHVMRPYPGWRALREQAGLVLGKCMSAAGGVKLAGVAVRYIDRISIPPGKPLNKYFGTTPAWPKNMPGLAVGFSSQVQTQDEKLGIQAELRVASAEADDEGWPTVIYDVLVSREAGTKGLSSENWLEQLDDLHDVQRSLFEASVTPSLRKLLGAE